MSTATTHRVIEWSPNESIAYDAVTQGITKVEKLSQLNGAFAGGSVVAAVSRRASFIKAIRVPNVGAADVNLILQTQMATMFPVPLHELAYSFRLTDDVNQEGRLAIVAAMRESDLLTLLADAKAANIKLERIVPAGFGSMLLSGSMGIKDAAVIQETTEGLAIDLLAEGELRYSRVAPMPANRALIESEITRSFQGVGLSSSPTLAAGNFAFSEAEHKSSTTTLAALATMPLEKLGIDLETRETRDKRERSRQGARTRLAMLLCASAALLALLVFVERSDKDAEVQKASGRWNRTLTEIRSDTKKVEAEVTKLQASAGTLERAFEPAQTPSDILTTISNLAPKGLWLTGTTFERGKLMYIRGTSAKNEAVADFLQALSIEPRLRDVKLVFANNGEVEKTPVVQFAIQAFPVGNLPLVDPKKKGAKK